MKGWGEESDLGIKYSPCSCVFCVVTVGSPCEYGSHAAAEPLWGVEPNDTHTMERFQTHLGGVGSMYAEVEITVGHRSISERFLK